MDDYSAANPQNPNVQPSSGFIDPNATSQNQPISQNVFVSNPAENISPPPVQPQSNQVFETNPAQPIMTTQAQPVVDTAPFSTTPPMDLNGNSSPPPPPPSTDQGQTVVSGESGKKKNKLGVILAIVVGLMVLVALIVLGVKFIPGLLNQGSSSKEITLTWWGLWEDQTIVAPIINKYQSEHPNVKINYIKQSPQDYRERLTNALAKGTGPDIYTFHNSWLPMFQSELDAVPADVITVDDFNKNYYPVMAEDLERGTNLYGLPTGYDGIALYINEDMFSTAGKQLPKTWDELRETALSLTIKDESGIIKQSGVALGRTENVDHWQEILGLMMLQNGVKMTEPEKCYGGTGGVVGGSSSGENCPGPDALSYFSLFSSVDGVWDETLPTSTTAFAGGKTAMYFAPSWRAFEIKQAAPGLKFKIVPVPQLAKSTPSDPDVNYATYWVSGVWKRSKERKASWEFMKFINSKESLQDLYTNAAAIREFGQPYPRIDMGTLLSNDPNTFTFVVQANSAKSWFLQSRTFDGPTGINSQINKYFEDAVNAVNAGTQAQSALTTVTQGVNQVLSTYGLATSSQAVQQ